MHKNRTKVVIIGAGPAGLTAAYMLCQSANVDCTVLEASQDYVGGISRTTYYKGYAFDIGGHRFFSKSKEVEDFWTELMGDELMERERLSRIFYKNQFYDYPLKPLDALGKLGIVEAIRCALSYAKAQVMPVRQPDNFEDWISNHFGYRLYSIFFKTYTEKVWGMDCREISADWAAQRIKGLSLWKAVANAFRPQQPDKNRGGVIKTMIDRFRYPRKGPGQMWERCRDRVLAMGGDLRMMTRATQTIYHRGQPQPWEVVTTGPNGVASHIRADFLITSAPLKHTILNLTPAVPPTVRAAAEALSYRDFITVVLIVKDQPGLKDNWIYIHDPDVRTGRIQNFKAWSPYMVPEEGKTALGMEYFCFEGDQLWNATDTALVEMATEELVKVGLCSQEDIFDGCVVRQAKAYPVYDHGYKERIAIIKNYLQNNYPTLYPVGRNGMHKYNNQDHSIMTAMLSVRNILAGANHYDTWQVNQDAEYIESGEIGAERLVPMPK